MVAGIVPPSARDAVDCAGLSLRPWVRSLVKLWRGRPARNAVPAELLTGKLHPGGTPAGCARVGAVAALAPPTPRIVLVPTRPL
eukprot:7518823-Alexandrium_andersonii.AAC.1